MRHCDCDKPCQPSAYEMLGLSETASEAELTQAYEAELARLERMIPAGAAEQRLLDSKRAELDDALHLARKEALPDRIHAQYGRQQARAVRLYSFFPVGLIGLLMRLLNTVCGVGGWCDTPVSSCCQWMDRECCSCSCCPNCSVMSSIYGSTCQGCICACPSSCSEWYENTIVVRFIDMGLAILAIISTAVCFVSEWRKQSAEEKRLQDMTRLASLQLAELRQLLQQRSSLVEQLILQRQTLQLFDLDITPFIRLAAALPGATKRMADMAERISQPDSLYQQTAGGYREFDRLLHEIADVEATVQAKAQELRSNPGSERLPAQDQCQPTLEEAVNGLAANTLYQDALAFRMRRSQGKRETP